MPIRWADANDSNLWDMIQRTGSAAHPALSEREHAAARELIRRVRSYIDADLLFVLLFGSTARGEARPDSDIDLLLIFRSLPPDREPVASQAENIADEIARSSGVPTTVWSVSIPDLEVGNRTPMLVDALGDGIVLWPHGATAPRVPFTRVDAVHCVSALLDRVDEGSMVVADHLRASEPSDAARRGRDDVVRLCTADLLLRGRTRPRRAEAVIAVLEQWNRDRSRDGILPILKWAISSYGPEGKDEERPVALPPGGFSALSRAVESLRAGVVQHAHELAAWTDEPDGRSYSAHAGMRPEADCE